jgi:hypothetical protein
MSQTPSVGIREDLPGGTLGVIDAMGMGWRLVLSDFWPLWLVGLVSFAIQAGFGIFGAIPYIGGCISLAVGIFVQPALNAGFFYAVRRRIDGAPAQVGDLFEGFRQRYWQSVVAMLVPMVIGFAAGLLIAGIVMAAVAIGGGFGPKANDEDVIVAMIVAGVIVVPLVIILILVMLLFMFSLLAVWDHPESGWAAVKDSARVVKAHFLSCVGLALLFALVGVAAYIAGAIALCVGVFLTLPFVMVWFNVAAIYLYRSWTGQALVQPIGAAPSGGPVPPTSIEPPPRGM